VLIKLDRDWRPLEAYRVVAVTGEASMQYIFKTDKEILWKVLEWMKRRGAGPHGGYVTVGLYGIVECEDIFDAIALLVIFGPKLVLI